METGAIFFVKKMNRIIKPTKYFTQISNSILLNNQISLKAKGLFAYLISKPDNYSFSASRIANEIKEGRDSILSALNEIEDSGYMHRVKKQDGKIDYYFFNFPSEKEKFKKEFFKKFPESESPTLPPYNNKEDKYSNNNNNKDKKNIKKDFLKDFSFGDKDLDKELIPLFLEYMNMRKEIKKPIRSQKSFSRNVNVLLSENTLEGKKLILDKAIKSEWAGLYPLTKADRMQISINQNQTYNQNLKEFTSEMDEKAKIVVINPFEFDTPQAFDREVEAKIKLGYEVKWVSDDMEKAKKKWGVKEAEKEKPEPGKNLKILLKKASLLKKA